MRETVIRDAEQLALDLDDARAALAVIERAVSRHEEAKALVVRLRRELKQAQAEETRLRWEVSAAAQRVASRVRRKSGQATSA